jgi:hypothetical protein
MPYPYPMSKYIYMGKKFAVEILLVCKCKQRSTTESVKIMDPNYMVLSYKDGSCSKLC